MSDTSRAQTRAHVDAEWHDLRGPIDQTVLKAHAFLSSLQDVPRPLFVDERQARDRADRALAEAVRDALREWLAEVTHPVRRRADDAGIDPDTLRIDLSGD